jgi:hypothetical protein
MDAHARHIVSAMKAQGVKRLVFVASLGIYDEVPGPFGKWNAQMIGRELKTYRRAADIIEAAGLDATIGLLTTGASLPFFDPRVTGLLPLSLNIGFLYFG